MCVLRAASASGEGEGESRLLVSIPGGRKKQSEWQWPESRLLAMPCLEMDRGEDIGCDLRSLNELFPTLKTSGVPSFQNRLFGWIGSKCRIEPVTLVIKGGKSPLNKRTVEGGHPLVFKSHACQNIDPLTLNTQEEDLHRRREEFLCLGNEG